MAIAGTQIAVAGAGIGGLSTALLLARAGAEVTLVERSPHPGEVGAALLLQPNGLAVLHGLGLADVLGERGTRVTHSSLRNADGAVITDIRTPDFGRGLDHVLAVRRSVLHDALLAAVRRESGIKCRFGVTVVAARPDGHVQLQESDGARAEITTELVVGADGVGSAVRSGGDFGAQARRSGHRYLRALVPRMNSHSAADQLSGEYWTPAGLFGGVRLGDDQIYLYADATGPGIAAAVAAADLAKLREAWAEALPLAGELLGRVNRFGDLLINDVSSVVCRRWHDGRLVLLGDAAHAMPPTAGQGANSALVDAAVLTVALSQQSAPLALRRYTTRRRHRVAAVQQRAAQLARLSGLRPPAVRRLRDGTLRLLSRVPGADQRLARSLQQEDPAQLLAAVERLRSP